MYRKASISNSYNVLLFQDIERGTEESILLVEYCILHFKIFEKDLKSTHLEPAVASIFRRLMEKPHFCKVFSCLGKHTEINEKLQFTVALANSDGNDFS